MGKDKHQTTEAVYIEYLREKQLFHVIPNNLLIPEDGIIGVKFSKKYNRYAITTQFLVFGYKKLLLHNDGEFIPLKFNETSQNQNRIRTRGYINPG